MKKYNGVKLDRKPMTITMLTEFIKPNPNGQKYSPGRNFENGRSDLQEKCRALFEAKDEKISKLPDLDDFLENKENFRADTMVKVAKTLGKQPKKPEKSFSFPVCVPKKVRTEKTFSFPVCVPKKIRKQDGSFLNDLLEDKENIIRKIAKIDAEEKNLGKMGKKTESTKVVYQKPKPTYEDLDKEMDEYMKARPNCR